MIERLQLYRRRLADESGHVGILMSLAIFVVVGMLMMTWNTANLSKEKMRLQNAADSAALGFCTWQARGMNAVQNINDEMYVALSMADKLLIVGVAFEIGALAAEAMESIPIVGVFFKALAQAFHIIAMLTGGMSGLLASRVCPWILQPLGYFYAFASSAFGWWAAEQLAAKNRADPLGNVSIGTGTSWFGNLGIYAIGISFPVPDTVMLPVEQDSDAGKKLPWKRSADLSEVFQRTHYGIYKTIHKALGTGKKWEFKPWVSTKKDGKDKKKVAVTPGPSVWIAHKLYTHIEVLPLDVWQRDFSDKGVRQMPMFAISAAQCISGDVVANSKKPKKGTTNNRTAGFGCGATAKLVPVAKAFEGLGTAGKVIGKAIGVIIYH